MSNFAYNNSYRRAPDSFYVVWSITPRITVVLAAEGVKSGEW